MADTTMVTMVHLRKAGLELDADLARKAREVVAQTVIEAEVAERIGAGKHERTPAHKTRRNGYRERVGEMPAGMTLPSSSWSP